MLRVLITSDTEVKVSSVKPDLSNIREAVVRDIYGITSSGEFGIRYQAETLNNHGLKGVFFLESLSAKAVGTSHLCEIVDSIKGRGHDTQLHVHAEWLKRLPEDFFRGRRDRFFKDFSQEEQLFLIGQGLEALRACGVQNICAFRSGNLRMNMDTLRALSRTGIIYDSSYDLLYQGRGSDLNMGRPFFQPMRMSGVCEIPVTVFQDWPGHYRHAQLSACSAEEMQRALLAAWRNGWYTIVILVHSLELVHRARERITPNYIVIKRFTQLCDFLSRHDDKFLVTTFSELDPSMIYEMNVKPLSSNVLFTAKRFAEQLSQKWARR